MAEVEEKVEAEAWAEMIYQSVRFANWAAGQGLHPAAGEPAEAPEDFLMAFSDATKFDDWEGLDAGARAYIATLRRERDEARAALAKERGDCAKVAEYYPAHDHGHLDGDPHYAAQQAAHEIAAAIRARTGETR